MREVAARLGVSSMTPYRYFKDKDALLTAVRTRAFTDFAKAMEEAAKKGGGAGAQSAAAGKAYEAFAFMHAAAYQLMFTITQKDAEAKDPRLQMAIEHARATMSYHVAQLVKEGVFEGDPELIGYVYWAAIHGLVMLELSGKFTHRYDFKKVRNETFRALTQGFLKRPHASFRQRVVTGSPR